MLNAIFLISIVIMPLIFAFFIADRVDRFRLAGHVFIAGFVFLVVLFVINSDYPFTGGGDDKDYYQSSMRDLNSFKDWFDFSYVNKRAEQGGYGLLLTWTGQFIGDDLFLRKAINISFFLILSVVWYSIGMKIGGCSLARVLFTGILLASPLWYYWMFLVKDMTIVLLQSIFLMGTVHFFAGGNTSRSIAIVAASTLLLIPFRVYLVFVNLGVLIAGVLLTSKGVTKKKILLRTLLVVVVVLAVLAIGTNKQMLEKFGVKGTQRSLEVATIEKNLDKYNTAKQYQMKRDRMYIVKYPVLFLIGESAGLNPRTWSRIDPTAIRGIMAVPWIFLGVPFFVVGIADILKRQRKNKVQNEGNGVVYLDDIASGQANKKLLLLILVFVLSYAAISWISTDTTRWRMPAMPAMVCIAGWGWVNMRPQKRILFLWVYGMTLALFVLGYYFMLR